MRYYSLLKPFLFAIDAELAHKTSLEMLNRFQAFVPKTRIDNPVQVMGLDFPNPVGLAAGLDKNADYLPGLSKFGCGFIEVGTVTPKPQCGNPKPRLFRLTQQQAIINRMGFNNKGVEYLCRQLPARPRPYKLGINIGKNLTTMIDQALTDYRTGLQAVYLQADYISINISSPNTPDLRQLENHDRLDTLLKGIHETRSRLQDHYQCNRPIAVKVSPDLDPGTIPAIADRLQQHQIDALIATNTTIERTTIKGSAFATEPGGLSGAPLIARSRQTLQAFRQCLDIPIISVGGIASVEEAQQRLDMGAQLVQLYSGLIYHGPGVIAKIAKAVKTARH